MEIYVIELVLEENCKQKSVLSLKIIISRYGGHLVKYQALFLVMRHMLKGIKSVLTVSRIVLDKLERITLMQNTDFAVLLFSGSNSNSSIFPDFVETWTRILKGSHHGMPYLFPLPLVSCSKIY